MTEVKDTAARFVTAFNANDEKTLNELHASDIKFSAPGGFKATNASKRPLTQSAGSRASRTAR